MESDEIYRFVGYAVVVIFFIYLISKAFTMNIRMIEGFTSTGTSTGKGSSGTSNNVNPDDITNEIKLLQTSEDTLKSYFQIDKNKDNYGALLDNLYTITNYRLLKLIMDNAEIINNKPDDANTMAAIKKINELKEFMETLSYSYKSLDNLSSNSGSMQ